MDRCSTDGTSSLVRGTHAPFRVPSPPFSTRAPLRVNLTPPAPDARGDARALASCGRQSAIAPEREQERQEREPELVDQRQGIRQHQVERGQQREEREQGREPEVQTADEARQERHAPSI